ncbi:3-deoxy-manno-octulosonate cytidylyltransferase (CMP-KDO synthetase) [Rubritalea squalenifaciens DSM 18772]|uniref:3-deoxy-manno-octulosonate cytidylyltransferase n=1 Tax=Rubritalea squalenifaciens DSM 18772 TaxID=1123071 RepID=A0A1M6HW44_9BACT|nr:3-deoxy-manno-octulosonate cytidylyltransferase [Rubritalea squalenifaciens]SHJ26429.1 3-deoxy-manno-octulosonate cytidylyltransferase (CMP-KDO synthetase) [Rubritalea squalenifaciens DSM 18772]
METLTDSPTFVLGIIPARWASTRFPGKPLHEIAGKPLVQHVWERCKECSKLDSIIVATDDDRILEACKAFGAEAVMTSDHHPTGTDRIAEAAEHFPQATHLINIQGDEPLICPKLIDELAQALLDDSDLAMATAANAFDDEALSHDPNVVKVVLRKDGDALYFSRSPLPYQRSASPELTLYRHKGIYAYRKDFLQQFISWPPSPLEVAESLEQLRALEHGARIKVIITDDTSGGVDTPEQAVQIENILKSTI